MAGRAKPPRRAAGISASEELGETTFLKRLEQLEHGLRLVQLREKVLSADASARLAEAVAARCAAHGARLVINSYKALAAHTKAGVHLTSKQLMALTTRPDLEWVGASCHDAAELTRAAELELDFVVLGPVLPTASHPGEPGMGWEKTRGAGA